MILSDGSIHSRLALGEIDISPFDGEIQPTSVDLQLDRLLLSYGAGKGSLELGSIELNDFVFIEMEPEGYLIQPGEFLLGSTVERIRVSTNLAARVEGKSSIGRLGLGVHVTAGFVDPGFDGTITLELFNHNHRPIVLKPGMKIAQVCFFLVSGFVHRPYGTDGLDSHYQNQRGPTPPK